MSLSAIAADIVAVGVGMRFEKRFQLAQSINTIFLYMNQSLIDAFLLQKAVITNDHKGVKGVVQVVRDSLKRQRQSKVWLDFTKNDAKIVN